MNPINHPPFFTVALAACFALWTLSLTGQATADVLTIPGKIVTPTEPIKTTPNNTEQNDVKKTSTFNNAIVNSPTIEIKQAAKIKRPKRGMTKTEVEKQFGSPNRKTKAVGDPPITRWFYNEFKVYFEYSHVIQSVENR